MSPTAWRNSIAFGLAFWTVVIVIAVLVLR
jgi:hypothetical protein